MDDEIEAQGEPVRTLTIDQRRVLGALLEKAFTTPDAYPLTIKALATACSQKSNRDPVLDYSEDEVEDALQQLQELGLVAELHTDGGRALRYRHLVRKRFTFSEPQLAILTELWLRGRQQMGELRSRASRMVPIATLEDLRSELQSLLEAGYVRSSGSLERRGVEVDHGFYPPGERQAEFSPLTAESIAPPRSASVESAPVRSAPQNELRQHCEDLEDRVNQLEDRLSKLEQQIESLLG